MADILSQDEVDVLLNAVSSGEVDVKGGESQEQFQPAGETVFYDFRRPERVSKEQLKGLQTLFDAFARELNIVLPSFLRSVVRVDLNSIDQLTYDEFILSVSRPTSLAAIDMAPLEGNAVIEMNAGLAFPIVDRVLGGKGLSLTNPRELTEIEDRILHRVIEMMLQCWQRSWQQLIEFDLTITNQESDPLIMQIVAGSEMVILVGYHVYIGELMGTINVCIPLVVLNPILDQISQQAHYKRRMAADVSRDTRQQIVSRLKRVQAPLDVILGHATLSLGDVVELQVGDVITLDTDVNDPIPVELKGHKCFLAKSGRRRERSAIQITDLITERRHNG